MSERADAHLHFFHPGYVATLPEDCRRVQPDEITLYQALAQQYQVSQVLAVGYEGESWAAGNNDYLAQLARRQAWIRPVAFVHHPANLDMPALVQWQANRFAGLSFYLFDKQQTETLRQIPDEVWRWLIQHRWLISVNSRGAYWSDWQPVLERFPGLRLLVSHLGLPPAVEQALARSQAKEALKSVLELARFPEVRVKLSGFYALSKPGYEYPHRAAWPYVELLLAAFGSERLLWGSDFSPSLEWVTFPQTLGLFAEMPFLTPTDIRRIVGDNLRGLLAAIMTGDNELV